MRKLLLIGACLCIALVGLGLTAYLTFRAPTVVGTESVSADFSSFPSLAVRNGNGSISIERIEGSEIKVDATIRARDEQRLASTSVIIGESSPGVCQVFIGWPDGERLRGEGADLRIGLPHAAELSIQTSNGDVRVDGLIAMITVSTTNGAIRVSGPAQQVHATTTNGTIDLDGIAGPVRVRSTNGRFDIALDPENPGPVFLMSTNGGGVLEVGSAFLGELFVRTSNGGITLDGFDENAMPRTIKETWRTKHFDFGPADHGSRLQTTNGDVVIRSIGP